MTWQIGLMLYLAGMISGELLLAVLMWWLSFGRRHFSRSNQTTGRGSC